tara:strand:+ start:526 stop:870 length:345 start_codon:yes stop_codon:yes gene_type:complete
VSNFSASTKTIAICDVCGFQYKLRELRQLVVNNVLVGTKACHECWNPDQPQYRIGQIDVQDSEAVRDPRPDSAELEASRDIQWGWNPVGMRGNNGLTPDNLEATGQIGTVTVTT